MVVLWFFSTETFAFYHLGAVEVPVSVLLGSATTVLIPQVSALYAAGRREAIGALWHAAVERLSLVVLPLFALFFALAGALVAVAYPGGYGQSAWVMRVFLLALPLRCAIYNPLLVGMGKARWALWAGAADLLLNLGLSLWGTQALLTRWPGWAFLGPAGAAVLATYAQVALLVGLIARHLGLGIGQLLPWRHLGRLGLLCGLAGALGWAGTLLPLPPVLRVVLGIAFFGAVLLVGSRPQDRQALGKVFKA
jgi:O-antigen/teichoic acid export membrane protein